MPRWEAGGEWLRRASVKDDLRDVSALCVVLCCVLELALYMSPEAREPPGLVRLAFEAGARLESGLVLSVC